MKLIPNLCHLINTINNVKIFKKNSFTVWLIFLGFMFVVNSNLVSANIRPYYWQEIVKSKQMVNMEVRLENEYESYFGRTLPVNRNLENLPETSIDSETGNFGLFENTRRRTHINQTTSRQIAKELAILDQKTNTKSAVVWVMPKEDFLHLVALSSQGNITVKDDYFIPSNKLVETVKKFYLEINEINNPMDLTLAQELYKWIIKPLEEDVLIPEKIDNILFCLGKGVRALPFAALHDGEKYAVEKYNMSRIPGFNLINLNYQSLETPSVLAMGASDFTEDEPLPGAGLELQTIVDRLQVKSKISDEDILFNQEFTLPNMQKQLQAKSFDIVHLATHADFNPGSPDNSYIQFWNEKLTLDRLSSLSWQNPPELLVLSACNTALGSEDAELGFTGIALQSGVKSALGSLWYVSDLGTLALITEFYEQLINPSAQNTTKVQSVTQAQNLLLHGDVYFQDNRLVTPYGEVNLPEDLAIEGRFNLSHPFYWASFTLISSPW